jgi:hypothetical protein
MSRELENADAERMLERYRQGLLTKQELEQFLELERHRSELRERALEAGRSPGQVRDERR